ncbi:hypothetical protein [Halarchaeum nitratireducens]|uniref:Uncharacterized protein n=1 Tax=Halarchaeum nitratireducens TaxID=489913 RepID=A0A830G7X2_9EURY|nr:MULTISPECIES: hypothetical protein [Halarchaeum]MBP2251442.1 hypothetical protein [Halarchaeum solikamskense]GGN07325.1 hypothetical protein GCM10009021_03000 [Halarchaeum nitratireducens]
MSAAPALLIVLAFALAVAGALLLYVLVGAESSEGPRRDREVAEAETRERVERRRNDRKEDWAVGSFFGTPLT